MSKKSACQPQRVILYGQSVILGTVGASLQKNPRFEVIPLSAPYPDAHQLEEMAPDAILFDLESARPADAFAMLATRPGLQLIGIDPDRNQVLVWSGQQLRELSSQELVKVIQKDKRGTAESPSAVTVNDPKKVNSEQSTVKGEVQTPERGDAGIRRISENTQFGIIQEE